MFNVVSVQFPGERTSDYNSKEYSYLTDQPTLEEGDLVVVDTQYGYKVAKVSCLFGNEAAANKWIVCKIDIKAFEGRLKELKHKQFILKQIKQRVEQQGFLVQAKAIAASDPVLQKLIGALDPEGTADKVLETS